MKQMLKSAVGEACIFLVSALPRSRKLFEPYGIRTSQGLFGRRIVSIGFNNGPAIRLTNVDESYLAFQLFWHSGEYYEPLSRALLTRLATPGDTFVDIGSHIGFFSLVAGCSIPGLNIVAFEPNPSNYRALRANLQANALGRARAEPIAISDRDGTAALYLTESDMSASLMEGFQAEDTEQIGSITVQTRSLDSYLRNVSVEGRLVLKVDIEGHEGAFFLGATDTLERYRPDIILEVLYEQDPAVVSMLRELGYRFYPITDAGLIEADSLKLVKRYPFLFLNYLLSTRPRTELVAHFEHVQELTAGIDLRKTSKHFPEELWPGLWKPEDVIQAAPRSNPLEVPGVC